MRLSLTLNQVFFDFVAYVGGAVFAAALPPRNDGVMSPEQQMELRKLLQSKNPEDLQKANKVRNWITDFHGYFWWLGQGGDLQVGMTWVRVLLPPNSFRRTFLFIFYWQHTPKKNYLEEKWP